MWSLLLLDQGRDVVAGVLFAVLLNMKHLFAYAGPAYFVYLLRHYCMLGGSASASAGGGRRSSTPSGGSVDVLGCIRRLALLGAAVVAVFAASLGPFVAMGQGQQVRLAQGRAGSQEWEHGSRGRAAGHQPGAAAARDVIRYAERAKHHAPAINAHDSTPAPACMPTLIRHLPCSCCAACSPLAAA